MGIDITHLREKGRAVIATRPLTINGANYGTGEEVDISLLPDYKVGQLLNHRLVRPMPDLGNPIIQSPG